MKQLPYDLTGAQKRTLEEIVANIQGPYVMQRLIQGDVGSGKTVIAFLAMAWAAESGYQSAIMAPTEVLARQHYETFCSWCENFHLEYPVVLLTGSMTTKEKRLAYEKLEQMPNAMIIGTHALIQEKAVFTNLALVITDEQHRFGVKQRDVFAEGVIFFLGGKQRLHTFYFKFHLDAGGKLVDHFLHRVKDVLLCI